MKVITGYLYHIKDEFFDKINAKSVMINHKNGHSRPSYLAIKDGKILWFIPLSSKIQKYQKIVILLWEIIVKFHLTVELLVVLVKIKF